MIFISKHSKNGEHIIIVLCHTIIDDVVKILDFKAVLFLSNWYHVHQTLPTTCIFAGNGECHNALVFRLINIAQQLKKTNRKAFLPFSIVLIFFRHIYLFVFIIFE